MAGCWDRPRRSATLGDFLARPALHAVLRRCSPEPYRAPARPDFGRHGDPTPCRPDAARTLPVMRPKVIAGKELDAPDAEKLCITRGASPRGARDHSLATRTMPTMP